MSPHIAPGLPKQPHAPPAKILRNCLLLLTLPSVFFFFNESDRIFIANIAILVSNLYIRFEDKTKSVKKILKLFRQKVRENTESNVSCDVETFHTAE